MIHIKTYSHEGGNIIDGKELYGHEWERAVF